MHKECICPPKDEIGPPKNPTLPTTHLHPPQTLATQRPIHISEVGESQTAACVINIEAYVAQKMLGARQPAPTNGGINSL